ncbi:putative glycosyl [Golovinomyces cichoracearum]|uniref:Putative glycosyl n=1 Tax=Golovinomyces cichoracearum TaxID=62708 RepID=A0A420HXB1_9PEZI|nr:putative glycosyl [Golovinomyces cichoracearum]
MKIYNEDKKYGGSPSELFDDKYETFCENCDMIGISHEERSKAFRIILKDVALEHYRAIARENKEAIPPLEVLYSSFKNVFEGQEHQQMILAKWNELSLLSVIEEQVGPKDVEKALTSLIVRLRTT